MCTVDSLYSTSPLFLYCIIHSCSYLSTIPVYTAWIHIVKGSSNHETGGIFQLIDTQLMPVVFLSIASFFSPPSSVFFSCMKTKNVLVKLTWTLRRSPLPFNAFTHSFRYTCAPNDWEEKKKTAQSERIVIESFSFVQSSPPPLSRVDPMSLWRENEQRERELFYS